MEGNCCPCCVCWFQSDGPGCPTDHGAVEHYRWEKKREFGQVTNVTAIRLSLENSPWGEALSFEKLQEKRIKNDEKATKEGDRFRRCDASKR